jgi:hypothetical protein
MKIHALTASMLGIVTFISVWRWPASTSVKQGIQPTASIPAAKQVSTDKSRPAWQNSLQACRHTPPARSESAWVAWADSVLDADLQAAILQLDPGYDIIPMQVLFHRWARLNGAAAYACFVDLKFPAELHEPTAKGSLQVIPRRNVLDWQRNSSPKQNLLSKTSIIFPF